MSAAWFCPACQKHHAPHVETCPGTVTEVRPIPGVNIWPSNVRVVEYRPDPIGEPWVPYWTTPNIQPFTTTRVYNPAWDPDKCVMGQFQ